MREKKLWRVSVATAPESEEAVVELVQRVLGKAASSYLDVNSGRLQVTAFLDANGDAIQQPSEPSGSYAGNPFSLNGNLSGVNVELTEPPYITSQPQAPPGNRVAAGGSASFSVGAAGTPVLKYQWFRDAVALVNGPKISGATTNKLQLTSLSAADNTVAKTSFRHRSMMLQNSVLW